MLVDQLEHDLVRACRRVLHDANELALLHDGARKLAVERAKVDEATIAVDVVELDRRRVDQTNLASPAERSRRPLIAFGADVEAKVRRHVRHERDLQTIADVLQRHGGSTVDRRDGTLDVLHFGRDRDTRRRNVDVQERIEHRHLELVLADRAQRDEIGLRAERVCRAHDRVHELLLLLVLAGKQQVQRRVERHAVDSRHFLHLRDVRAERWRHDRLRNDLELALQLVGVDTVGGGRTC